MATALVGLSLTACATRPPADDIAAVEAFEEANDPFEPTNRFLFEVHNTIDDILLRPLAEVYDFVLPGFAKDSVRHFMDNLATPVILANDILQWEWDRAGTTTSRFLVNTTVGVAGLMDPASNWGLERHGEDFGQTLAVYGITEGPYLFLPVLGPAPFRDLVGFGVDRYIDPLTHIFEDDPEVLYGRFALNGIDLRARNLQTIDDIERTSIDYYAAVRSLYRQSRNAEIRNGESDFESLPDISDIDLEDYEEEEDPSRSNQ